MLAVDPPTELTSPPVQHAMNTFFSLVGLHGLGFYVRNY